MHQYKTAFPRVVRSAYTDRSFRVSPRKSMHVVQVRTTKDGAGGADCIAVVERDGEKRLVKYGRLTTAHNAKDHWPADKFNAYNDETWQIGQQLSDKNPRSTGGGSMTRRRSNSTALTVIDPAAVARELSSPTQTVEAVLAVIDELNTNVELRGVWNKLSPRLLKHA